MEVPPKSDSPSWTHITLAEVLAFVDRSGLSYVAFAAMVGVTNSTFHNWKSGATVPSADNQLKLREAVEGRLTLPKSEPRSEPVVRAPRRSRTASVPTLEALKAMTTAQKSVTPPDPQAGTDDTLKVEVEAKASVDCSEKSSNDGPRTAILGAMRRFDGELRANAEWVEWELRPNVDSAVLWNGRLYPPEQILVMSSQVVVGTGIKSTFKRLGFRVVQMFRMVEKRARDYIESCALPDEPVRDSYCKLLAECVELARRNTDHWWVTLKADKKARSRGIIWLNIGTAYRQTAEWPAITLTFDDQAFAALDLSALRSLGCKVTPSWVERSTNDRLNQLEIDAATWERALPLVRRLHLQSIERVSSRVKRGQPSAWDGYSPGLLDYLSAVVGRTLPRPQWAAELGL